MNDRKDSDFTGKDEMNLVEFPVTLIDKRNNNDVKTIEISDCITGEDGKPIKREWTVTGSDKYGLPLAQDNEVLIALLKIGKEQNFKSSTIYFSKYRLLQIMGKSNYGKNYHRLEESLDRFKGVSIKAKNAFWDNRSKTYITVNFGIIDSYKLLDSTKKSDNDESIPYSFVRLNEEFFNSIDAGYIKNLDIDMFFSIKGYIAKQLFRYLDKKIYNNKKRFEIGLHKLAETHLGMFGYKYPSEIKRKLDAAHKELIDKGFLKSVEYKKSSDGLSEKVIYNFKDKKKLINKPDRKLSDKKKLNSPDIVKTEENTDEMLEAILKIGVTKSVAKSIAGKYPHEQIKFQIEVLPFRKPKEPAALLIKAIKENWAPPAEFTEMIESAKKAKAYEEKIKKEQEKKEDIRRQIEDYIAGLSETEKAELIEEATEMAMLEGDKLFGRLGLPPHILQSYMFVKVKEKLNL